MLEQYKVMNNSVIEKTQDIIKNKYDFQMSGELCICLKEWTRVSLESPFLSEPISRIIDFIEKENVKFILDKEFDQFIILSNKIIEKKTWTRIKF